MLIILDQRAELQNVQIMRAIGGLLLSGQIIVLVARFAIADGKT
jgi:hypothetical protein